MSEVKSFPLSKELKQCMINLLRQITKEGKEMMEKYAPEGYEITPTVLMMNINILTMEVIQNLIGATVQNFTDNINMMNMHERLDERDKEGKQ